MKIIQKSRENIHYYIEARTFTSHSRNTTSYELIRLYEIKGLLLFKLRKLLKKEIAYRIKETIWKIYIWFI